MKDYIKKDKVYLPRCPYIKDNYVCKKLKEPCPTIKKFENYLDCILYKYTKKFWSRVKERAKEVK